MTPELIAAVRSCNPLAVERIVNALIHSACQYAWYEGWNAGFRDSDTDYTANPYRENP